MPRHRSSIFSSDTLSLADTPRDWWLSLILGLLIVAAAETGVRLLLGPGIAIPDYWDESAGEKYEWYRAQELAPELLVIGDSSAARNFAPDAIEEGFGGGSAFNLGTPGNFPLSLRATTHRMLERESTPRIVVLSQAIHSLYDSAFVDEKESLILDARATRYFNDALTPADHVFLARAYDHRTRIVHRLLGRVAPSPSPPQKGFMPSRHTGKPIRVPDGYFGEQPPSPDRLGVISELAQLARERGFRLVVTLPVQLDEPAQHRIERHRQWLLNHAQEKGFGFLDMRSVLPPDHQAFSDVFHLAQDGAILQSRALGAVLSECMTRDDWQNCLADRPLHAVDLVDGPRWIPERERAPESPDAARPEGQAK